MSHRYPFACLRASVLLAWGLIAGVLPGRGFAQERSRDTVSDEHRAKTQAASVPTTGLIGWWKLDETTGTSVPDSSGNEKHGVRVNNPTYQPGVFGDCLHFNNRSTTADNAHVIIDSYPEIRNAVKSGTWSISLWARPDRIVERMGECLVFSDYQGVSWSHESGFVSAYYISNDDTRWSRGAVHPTGLWYHVCGVVDTKQGTNRIYVNGNLEGTVRFPVGKTTGRGHTRLLLAVSDPDPNREVNWRREAYQGSIDQVRVYNRPLSAAEVRALSSELAAGVASGTDAGGGAGALPQGTPDASQGVPATEGSTRAATEDSGHAADWPQFRGPNRDGRSPETGLLKTWPEAGPRLVRTIGGLGEGYSSPSIAGGRLYISGKVGPDLRIFCFDLSGEKLWETTHGPAYDGETAPHSPYPGARAAPTIDGDMLYLLSGLGRLAAYRTGNGGRVWTVDVVGELGGRVPPWGYAESVLIDGDRLICTPGGEETGTFAALDKMTGRVLWQSKEATERAEYGSPILIEFEEARQVVTMTRGGLVAVSPENGALLWRHNRVAGMRLSESTTAHCNPPVYADGYVFEATGYQTRGGGTVALRRTAAGIAAEPVWESKRLNSELGGYVLVDGFIYATASPGWRCVELKTGKEGWSARGPGKGSVIAADGMLYCLGETGKMGLIKADPAAFRMVSLFELPKGEGRCWAHPVISDGKLYLRWSDNLYVYDIRE